MTPQISSFHMSMGGIRLAVCLLLVLSCTSSLAAGEDKSTVTITDKAGETYTEFGQAEEFGPWRIKVVNIDQADSITVLQGTYWPSEGRTLCLVEVELENTADAASTLDVDPQQIEVVDSEEEAYMSIGGAPVGTTIKLHIYHVGGSSCTTIKPASGGPVVTFTATAIDKKTKEWTIELSGKGSAKLTMAFNIPSDAQVKELRWPELRPFSLEQ